MQNDANSEKPESPPAIREGGVEIPVGMKPWTGGDAAPADYAGQGVLYRDGKRVAIDYRYKTIWEHRGNELDIIAYTPSLSPEIAEQPMGEVTQADRDTAATVMISSEGAEAARTGKIDDNSIVQAFMRHRLAATPKPADSTSVAGERDDAVEDEFDGLEPWEHEAQRQLSLLFRHRFDDSLQFNRGQMREAVGFGARQYAAEVETYRQMHDIATKDLGYPSILEALEATPRADGITIWAQAADRIEAAFSGYGIALRRKDDPPIPGEPLMSMAAAKRICLELFTTIQALENDK